MNSIPTYMNSIRTKLFLMTLMSPLLVACGGGDDNTVLSEGVATGQMYATFQVISDGDGDVYAKAQLTDGIPPLSAVDESTFVRLVGSDELWFSAGDDLRDTDISDDIFGGFQDLEDVQAPFKSSVTRRDSHDFLYVRVIISELGTWYSARLPESEALEYRISLFRDGDDGTSARDSVVILPEAFNLVSPSTSERLSRSEEDIVITWTNADAASSVEVEAITTCADTSFDSYSVMQTIDVGTLTINAGDLDSVLLSGNCSTTLNVRKVRIGEFDSRFIGGAVNGYQVRRMVFVTVP